MEKKFLPIGTVVQLEGKSRKIMITGYSSKMVDSDKVFDYNGIIFPDGLLINLYGLFNESDIAEVFYEGYRDDSYDKYISTLQDVSNGHALTFEGGKNVAARRRGRVPKEPTRPLSKSELKSMYTRQEISGGQTEVFDFSQLRK